jgi:hypothetical protein
MTAAQSNNNHESDDVLKLYALARLCAECHWLDILICR